MDIAPTVSITSPANNAVFAAPAASIPLTATAADSDGTVAKVEFFNGATLIGTVTAAPYTFNWTNVAAGSYSLTAKATDNLNVSTTSAPITITVSGAPTVTLVNPLNNASFNAPANILLTATAADDGPVAKVEFFNGATLIGTVTTTPYSINWAGVPVGNYTLTAKATDNFGLVTTSAPVNITVQAPAAPAGLYFIHPDHLNTPRLITNQAGTVVWRWDNDDPFGNNLPNENPNGVGNFTCNLRLPGQYFDRETNLHYNYFRDYDPSIGRYVQSDPIGLAGGINTYGYVGGNPISYFDPLGLICAFIPTGSVNWKPTKIRDITDSIYFKSQWFPGPTASAKPELSRKPGFPWPDFEAIYRRLSCRKAHMEQVYEGFPFGVFRCWNDCTGKLESETMGYDTSSKPLVTSERIKGSDYEDCDYVGPSNQTNNPLGPNDLPMPGPGMPLPRRR